MTDTEKSQPYLPGDVATPPPGEGDFTITVCINCGGSIRHTAAGLWFHHQTSDTPCDEITATPEHRRGA